MALSLGLVMPYQIHTVCVTFGFHTTTACSAHYTRYKY